MAGDLKHGEQRTKLDAVALNEQLMVSLVRQHELTETAEALNEQLQAEILVRKKAQEALISSEKLASAGRMAAVLAHEINNPLEAVTNLLYLAKGGTIFLNLYETTLKRQKLSSSVSPTSLAKLLVFTGTLRLPRPFAPWSCSSRSSICSMPRSFRGRRRSLSKVGEIWN